jgi:hypothetical protein
VRSRIVLKKHGSFLKLAPTFGAQLLLQFVEKWLDGCILLVVFKPVPS